MAGAVDMCNVADVDIFWHIVSNGSDTMLMPNAEGLLTLMSVFEGLSVEVGDVTNAYLAAGVSENVLLTREALCDRSRPNVGQTFSYS